MKKCTTVQDVPLGLGSALETYNGLDYFFSLSGSEQQQIIGNADSVQSKEEMLAYAKSIMENNRLT